MSKSKNFTYNNLKSKNGSKCREKYVIRNFPEKYNNIISFKKENTLNLDFPELLYCYLHTLKNVPTCKSKDCDGKLSFESFNYGYKGTFCSVKCGCSDKEKIAKTKKTIQDKYGVDHISQVPEIKNQIKKTIQNKYGVDNIMHLPETSIKIKSTMLERYGVDNAMKLDKFLKKSLETNRNNHGGELSIHTPEVRKKRNKTVSENFLEKYQDINFINPHGNEIEFSCGCIKNETIQLNRATFRFRYNNNIKLCTLCNPIDNNSYGEKTLFEFITSIYEGEIITNDRKVLNGKELDILLPQENLAIEYNGLYWHSNAKVDKNYHLNKTEKCNLNGYKLLHVFEDEWINKFEIIKSIIRNNLKITKKKTYARLTIVKEISTKVAKKFLVENHIQGYCNSTYKFGLYDSNGILTSVMTFGHLRKSLGQKQATPNHYEMLRFANKINSNVVGGASKLYKYFLRNYKPVYVLSYANRRFFDGAMYKTLGLEFVKTTTPNYFYIKKSGDLYERENRFKYRKDVLVKEGYDPNKSEREIMEDRGFLKIYDCGTYKFEKWY